MEIVADFDFRVESNRSEYSTWRQMLRRCYEANHPYYSDYGGRGVSVCDRWKGKNGFKNFLADMGKRPSEKHSIDRFPDNDGNYLPSNCRWATMTQQARNRRSNRVLIFEGEAKTVAEWAELLSGKGITYSVIINRINRGWSVEKALTVAPGSTRTESVRRTKGVIIAFGEQENCIAEWSRITGLSEKCIRHRLFVLGWSPEKTLTEPSKKRGSSATVS